MDHYIMDIKLKNTPIKFQFQYKPQSKVIDIINVLITYLKLSDNVSKFKFFFKGEIQDNSTILDQQANISNNLEAEIEFTDQIEFSVNNQKLGSYQLKCDISATVNQLNSILLNQLTFNSNYSILFTTNNKQLNKDKYLIELAAQRTLNYQVFSHNYFIYNKQQFKLEIDVTISISDLCKMIGDKINIPSQKIQLDQMDGNNPFHYYHVNPDTELKYTIIEIQEIQDTKQVTVSIVNGEDTQQITILKEEKVQTLINLILKSFLNLNQNHMNIKLMFNGIELQHNNTIKHYNLTNNCVIQLIMSKTPQYIQICLQHKEKPDLKKKMKISLDDQFSVIDEQVFLNKQMEYYYQGQLINKKQTFRQLQITQNDTVIEHQPLQGDQILIKFQHLEQNDIKEFLVQSNELLSEYIYKLIGKKTKDVWVSINNQEIENIEQTFAALKIQNALILYQHLQIKLQVWHNGNASEVIVDRDKCVIDLFYILRNHFQIADQQLIELEYGNQNVQGVLLNQKLWAASQKPYKVVILKQDQLSGKNQSIKLYFINKKQYVDFSLDLDQKIEQFQKEFLFLNSYPKNQPVECYIKHQVDPINKEIQIKTLNIQELQIEVKDLINVGTLNKINKEHNYFEVYFNSMISILYDHLKVNNCNFFFKNKPIKQDLTFQDIEFYDMDTIEYEIIQTSSFVKIIVIENNQQQDIELDNQLTIQDLRQQLNIRSSFDLLLEDDQVVKDDQILRELARDGKLKLNLRQIKKLPTEKRKQQSEIIYYKRNLEDQIHVNELPQNKYQLSVSILGVIHQIEFEENKQVKDLRQVIIEKYKQKDDIVIRYKNNILSSSDPIPYSSEVIFVFPYVINVKIHVSQKKQTFDKKLQPHEKIGDIISKLVQQIKTKSNSVKLIMGNQILDVNKTIKELGIVDGAELNLMI